MNSKKTLLAAATLSAVVVAPLASAAANPFTTTELAAGFNMDKHADKDMEGKCGEGKCGAGMENGKHDSDDKSQDEKPQDEKPQNEKPQDEKPQGEKSGY